MQLRFLAAAALLACSSAAAQGPPDPSARIAAQRAAMERLAVMDGVWRGPAWTLGPQGRRALTQTERVGTVLGGTVRMFEGRGYEADGSIGFNAVGVVSFDPASGNYTLTSWVMGYSGSFPLRLTEDGYVWEAPAGPGAVIRYTATISDGAWREIGERIAGDAPPVQVMEMNLRRVGDTAWPGGDPVPMR